MLSTFNVVGDGSDVGWQLHNGQAASPPFALYYGNPENGNYNSGARTFGQATSSPIDVPISAHTTKLEFNVWLDLGSFFFDDLLSARILVGQNAFTVWERTELGFADERVWVPISVTLPTQVAGRTIRVRFVFDSIDAQGNQGEGAYIDDIRVFSECGP